MNRTKKQLEERIEYLEKQLDLERSSRSTAQIETEKIRAELNEALQYKVLYEQEYEKNQKIANAIELIFEYFPETDNMRGLFELIIKLNFNSFSHNYFPSG